MTDKVIDFAQARLERSPHWSGPARCVACRHDWVAVAPAGEDWLECPACGLMKGRARHPFAAAEGDRQLVCNCGCDVMYAGLRRGFSSPYLRCVNCGADQTEAFLRP